MGLINSKDTFLFYHYFIKEFYIIFENEMVKIDDVNIKDFSILDDYVNNLYPIFKMDIALTESMYYRIIENKDTVQFKIYIQAYYTKNTLKKKSVKVKIINDVFSLILDDDDEFLSKEAHKNEYPNGDKNNMNAVTVSYEMFLFKKDLLKRSRETLNTILQYCDVTTALAWMLTKLNLKNVLMDKADNKNRYNMIFPPLSIPDEIQWLDSYYGIYKTGSIIYFGLIRSYILRFGVRSKAFETGELTNVSIIVPKVGGCATDNICQLKKKDDNTKYYVIADPQSFDPKTESTSNSIISQEEIEVVNSKSGETGESSSSKNVKVITTKSINDYVSKTYKAQVDSGNSVITVLLKDIDFTIITPNKLYQFIFEDTSLSKKYKGKYFLCRKQVLLSKESKCLSASLECEFRKIVS